MPEAAGWADALIAILDAHSPLCLSLSRGGRSVGRIPLAGRCTLGRQSRHQPPPPHWDAPARHLIVADAEARSLSRRQVEVRRVSKLHVEVENLSTKVPMRLGTSYLEPGRVTRLAVPVLMDFDGLCVTLTEVWADLDA